MSKFEALRRAQILSVYHVMGDPETGEWLAEPVDTGATTTAWDWAQRSDTDTHHYSTYVYDPETQAERALIVEWGR